MTQISNETLLRILFENDREDIIALAVKIDAEIPVEEIDIIKCRITKHDLAEGTQFQGSDKYNGTVTCCVVSFNKYKLKENYLVRLPNGTVAWKSTHDDKLSIIEDIPEQKIEERHPDNA